jgi:hypothetical protein
MTESRTISVSIRRSPDEVYGYLAEPLNLPRWSGFITEVRKHGEHWSAVTTNGIVRIRFVDRNNFRILDHWVSAGPNLTVYVPMRVLANEVDGSEVIFTVFRLPGMSDQDFEADIQLVRADLATLKQILEHTES